MASPMRLKPMMLTVTVFLIPFQPVLTPTVTESMTHSILTTAAAHLRSKTPMVTVFQITWIPTPMVMVFQTLMKAPVMQMVMVFRIT